MTKYNCLITIIIASISYSNSFGQTLPGLRTADKVRIREAIDISDKYGDRLFSGYSAVPFAIVLVTDSTEFLIYHPNPSEDFKLIEYDTLLKSNVYYRKTQFSTHFLATFPAVNGLSCIVVGTPENTGKNSTEWIITLLHEHFHQYQASDPEYYQSVNALDLSDGDQSGMWMLSYPFPYTDQKIKTQFESYSVALSRVLMKQNTKAFNASLSSYFFRTGKIQKATVRKGLQVFLVSSLARGIGEVFGIRIFEAIAESYPGTKSHRTKRLRPIFKTSRNNV